MRRFSVDAVDLGGNMAFKNKGKIKPFKRESEHLNGNGYKKGSQKRDTRRMRMVAVAVILAIAVIAVFTVLYLKMSLSRDGASTEGSAALPVPAILVIAILPAISLIIGLWCFLRRNEKKLFSTSKNVMIIMLVIILAALISVPMTLVSTYFNAMLLAVILSAVLMKRRVAYSVAVVSSIIGGLMAFSPIYSTSTGLYMVEAWIPLGIMLAQFVGGCVSVYALKQSYGRMAPILSGFAGGLTSALVYMCVQAVVNRGFSGVAIPALWLIGDGLLCGVVATGLMPVFEVVLDVATDARLNELMNNNNPLIKRLMIEAPGTYHHSMLVSALAESAAEAVGANALLCKASGYYHDVGKLRSPMHFIENQRGQNIHDSLPPDESADCIIAHRKDGVTLLSKYKIPSDVIRICAEHHGNSTVVYFYNKAIRQAAEGEVINEEDYKYKAPKPSSKESGILMLADCCEAAVRSVKNPSCENIALKVREVIAGIWLKRDGQLSECDLTAKDVKTIETVFINTLTAQYHERIEYPKAEENDSKDEK